MQVKMKCKMNYTFDRKKIVTLDGILDLDDENANQLIKRGYAEKVEKNNTEDKENTKEDLWLQADDIGLEYDKRWSVKKLKSAIREASGE